MTTPGEHPPLIFVDLLEVPEPKARKLLGPTRTRWQPWRILVTNGGNHEPLFRSTERWTNRSAALDAVQAAFGMGSDVFLRTAEKSNVRLRSSQ